MPLFQQSVLKKYINDLDKKALNKSWQLFRDHFFNAIIQQNIRNSKEEEYQEGFVRDLFVNVFGYTLNPQPHYNFVLEKKTITDATKSDGAILLNFDVVGVVELKDTGTPDLDKVSNQAFGYKNKHKNCHYVITSNFEKLRFYINDATEYEEFNLFTLTEERFVLLYLCLQQQNLLSNVPLQLKQQSLVKEENVTKELYADYSFFKRTLFQNIAEQNPKYEKLLLFKKTQKLLDRFLFIFFAEDRLLLPPNSVREILKQWEQLRELDNYVPLYDRFKKYFGYLNVGHVGKQHEIFAYNGGLFLPDEVLDNITINDTLLHDGATELSKYDYETEVDVNILGHIFEHSLTEIEELQQQLEGKAIEKSKTKRKKEGVFYTPRYITKYIVENTVGALCTQKKEELEINEEAFAPQKRKANRKVLLDKIEAYRRWLLELTICDPACGSGAFLNAALEYLKLEHKTLDELTARVHGTPMVFAEMDTEILENNLFGVDINEDAIEIAKLSLWLHTAKKGRKLSNLSNNIKVGNSLIDDPEVAGDKAFNWKEEFPDVFAKGGFDVVIGNPPYVRQELIRNYSKYLNEKYSTFSGKADLFVYFFEKALQILKRKGLLGFISSGKFFEASYGKPLVKLLVEESEIKNIIDFGDYEVFQGISAYPLILITQSNVSKTYSFKYTSVKNLSFNSVEEIFTSDQSIIINKENFIKNDYKFFNEDSSKLIKKLYMNAVSLKNLKVMPLVGIKTGFNEGFITDLPINDFVKPYVFGKNIKKYNTITPRSKIVFPYKKDNNYKLIDISIHESLFKNLEPFKKQLSNRAIIKEGLIDGTKRWWEYQQIKKDLFFDNEYIVYPNVSLGNNFTLSKGNVLDMTAFIIPSNDKGLLAILNSKLVEFLMKNFAISRRGGYLEYKSQYLEKLPIKTFDKNSHDSVTDLVHLIIAKNKELNALSEGFSKLLQSKFPNIKINNKLQQWFQLTSAEFLKELTEQKIRFSLSEQHEWLQYFEEQKAKANTIQQVIQQTDMEIDAMVYQLYGLSEEEIKIVEGTNK